MNKIHALLEVVKDKEEIERQISELTFQIELHIVNRKGLQIRLEQIKKIEKAQMIQAASCSATITHVIKPFETLADKQRSQYKDMITEIQNLEESQEKADKMDSLLQLIELDEVKPRQGKPVYFDRIPIDPEVSECQELLTALMDL